MNYYFEDFTETNYEKLLKTAALNKVFIYYDEINKADNELSVLWRHDVDYSPQRALSLAKIENKYGLKSTYFFQTGAIFYNLFEINIQKVVKEILGLNHQIGVHFDPSQYDVKTEEELIYFLEFEKKIFENLFGVETKVFSFHNPTPEVLSYDKFTYAGMINTYASELKSQFVYCSDSNGYWRHKRLKDFLNDNTNKNIQVLTHPAWWQENVMPPYERIARGVYGRAEKTLETYVDLLHHDGRENVR